MTLEEFITDKQSDWTELKALLDRIKAGNTRVLSATDLDQLGYLYRRVTSDLAIARRDFPHDRLVRYLNDLAAQTHASVYQAQPLKKKVFLDFFLRGFPRLFRANIIYTATAFLLFGLAFAVTYLLVLSEPQLGERLLPSRLVETIKKKKCGPTSLSLKETWRPPSL